ncbi:MAG: helix-turn-helix transcriptional regulator [Lachnospiraceae bacterium]|nr:helix-turn-helix transcriptional regulator [Lachnospiraceae bacterium]
MLPDILDRLRQLRVLVPVLLLPVGTLNKILSGATRDPKLETLKAIARVLGLSLNDFDDEPYQPTTIAAHHEGDDYTPEEWEEIEKFKMFVKSKRGQ